MGKKRWQNREGSSPPPTPATPSSAAGPGARGRWRWRGTSAATPAVSRSTVKGISALFGLVIVLAGLVMLVLWLSPVPLPKLVVLSARYRADLLPPNGMAIQDAVTLCSQTDAVDASSADPRSLPLDNLKTQIAGIPTQIPSQTWFHWEKTTTLVYVNLLGVALYDPDKDRSVPYLLPEDFQVPTQQIPLANAVTVRSLLENLLKSPADQKLLVLDCQRMDHHWPLGTVRNEFVAAVKRELEEIKGQGADKLNGLAVLFSCSENEVTWIDNKQSQSTFGYFFARGVAGEADGDGNRRLTLAELADYLKTRVSAWTRQNRADSQTPELVSFGIPADAFTLLAPGRSTEFKPPPKPGIKEGGIGRAWSDYHELGAPANFTVDRGKGVLEKGWRDYYELAVQNPPPWEYAPEAWRFLEETLTRAEQFWRAGDGTGMRDELANLDARFATLQRAKDAYVLHGVGFSLPMQSLFGNKDAGFQKIVADVVAGQIEVATAAQNLTDVKFRQERFPIEAYLLRMMNDHLLGQADILANLGEDQIRRVRLEARNLAGLRVRAEEAAVPALQTAPAFAPDLFRWARAKVDQADKDRRLSEDLFFTRGSSRFDLSGGMSPLPGTADEEAARLADAAQRRYASAIQDSAILADAVKLQQRLLAELPHVARLVAARPWIRADDQWMRTVRGLADQIFKDAKELEDRLGRNPADLVSVDADVQRIDELTRSLGRHRDELEKLLAGEAEGLGGNDRPPETQNEWHRLNDILLVPFPAKGNDPGESARIRVRLVSRVLSLVSQESRQREEAGQQAAAASQPTLSAKELDAHATYSANVANHLYSLGTGEEVRLHGRSLAAVGYDLGRAWRTVYDIAVARKTDPDDVTTLLRQASARRILDGYAALRQKNSQDLRRLNISQYLAWQADRFANDFWAGSEGDSQPYFQRAASTYLEQAEAVAPTAASWLPPAKQSLERLSALAGALQLKTNETLIRFRGGDEQTFDLDVTRPGDYPNGVATLRAKVREPEKATLSIAKITSGSSTVPVTLKRQGSTATTTSVDTELLFRGHSRRLSLPLELPDYEVGPTVVYENRRVGDAKVSVRLREFETSNRKILFVLDCSGSMRPRGGKDKMTEMQKILMDFAASVEDRTVDVGVRLLGFRVPWVGNPPPELLPEAMKDTDIVLKIAPFEREQFDNVIQKLNAVGGTPLYKAIEAARADLDRVPGDDKVILIISDGEDIFLGQENYPTIRTLQNAFAGSGIEVNAIGFGYEARDDFSQLQSLVKLGSGTGEAKKVDSGKGLLDEITRLSGVYSFVARTPSKSYPPSPQRLGVVDKPVSVPPGAYDLQVLNTRDQLVDQRNPLRVDAGEWHRFVLRSRRLEYEFNDFPEASFRADSSQTGVSLRILEARPIQHRTKNAGQGLSLKFALFKKEDPAWRPRDVQILVYPRDQELLYTCQDLVWNEPDFHLPVWGIEIEDWPENTREADVEVRWSDPSDPAPPDIRFTMDQWRKKSIAGKLPEGIRIASWVHGPSSVEQQTRNTTRVLLEFPANYPRFQEWCVTFGEQPIDYARQVYNTSLGVYAGRFILRNEEDPRELVLRPPRDPVPGKVLRTKFRIGGNPLFQN